MTENQEREITVKDLNHIIATKARAANHPVFGDISVQQQPTTPGNVSKIEADTTEHIFSCYKHILRG